MQTAAIAYGFFSGLHVGNIFPAAANAVEPADYGFAAGLLNLSGGLAGGAGILLAGTIKDSLGIPFPAGLGALACAGGGLVLAIHALRQARRV